MNTYTVEGMTVKKGIKVSLKPFSHLSLRRKRDEELESIWIPIMAPQSQIVIDNSCEEGYGYIYDISIKTFKDAKDISCKYFIVEPQKENEERVCVLWRVSSGYNGGEVNIIVGENITTIIKSDSSWRPGRRDGQGFKNEILVLLGPGQEIFATRDVSRKSTKSLQLNYDGKIVEVFPRGGDIINIPNIDLENLETEYL